MNAQIKPSTRTDKKYMVNHNNKTLHFGNPNYEHFKDSTSIKKYSNKDHNDVQRLINFYKRHFHDIKESKEMNRGNWRQKRQVILNKTDKTARYYSGKYLW